MNTIQGELSNLYTEYLENIFSDSNIYEQVLNFKISSPLFIDSTVEYGKYVDSDFKVLYIGQETNCWYNENERKSDGLLVDLKNNRNYIDSLIARYKKFNLGHQYKTPIFSFMDILVGRLRDKHPSTGFLWTNLLRHDGYNGKVSDEVEKRISYHKNYVLRKELEILKPNAIVFVSGPNYDYILENSFDGLKKNKIDNKPEREMCFINHINLPEKTIRVYHPNYHKYKGKDYRCELADKIVELLL